MQVVELSGTPMEIGRKCGAECRELIHKSYETFFLPRKRVPGSIDKTVVRYMERRCPYLLEEMIGIAEGAGMTYDEILALNHFKLFKKGCTPAFFKNTEVGPVLAQNLDTGTIELNMLVMRIVRPLEGNAFISPVIAGTVWVGTGMNDKGLCLTGVSAYPKHTSPDNGTSGGVIARDMLQHADTVEEMLEIDKSHTYIGKMGVKIMMDRNGKAVTVEKDLHKQVGIPLADFGFSTGTFESGEIEPDASNPVKEARRKTIRALHDEGKIEFSLAGMKKLLSHHCTPGPVCRHRPWEDTDGGTMASRIMIPNRSKFLMTIGPPCKNEYREYTL